LQADNVIAVSGNERSVNIDGTEIVDQHGKPQTVGLRQHGVDKAGFAGAQKSGHDCYGDGLPVHRGNFRKCAVSGVRA
jgi:hypothetical protein